MENILFTKPYRIFSYKLMKRLGLLKIKWLRDNIEPLRPTLRRAKLFVTVEEYIAMALFTAIITTPVVFAVLNLFVIGFIMGITGTPGLIISLILSMAYLGGTIFSFILYPSYLLNTRREHLEKHLPYAAAHMATIAGTGVPMHQVFKIVGKFDEYKEVAEECKRIGRNIDVFGYDTITAVSEAAKETPSPSFKDLLWGLVSITRTGGDARIYLLEKSNQFLEEQQTRQREFIDTLEIMAEVYTTLFVAGPVLAIIMLTVMGTVGGIPFPLKSAFTLMIYLLLPIMSVAFMLVVEGSKPALVT